MRRASASPASPVAAFAQPAFTTTARARPAARCSRETSTGAACARLAVNTPAAVKAESDVCCTSANAVEVVESLGVSRVIFVPDGYLGRWVVSRTAVEVILWEGRCEVHERFTAADLRTVRETWPGVEILAHPECPPDVLREADYTGSTSGMIRRIAERRPARVALITECTMADNVAVDFPEIEFVRPCNLCPHMRRITLEKVRSSLETLEPCIEIPEETARRARRAVERMLEVGRGKAR